MHKHIVLLALTLISILISIKTSTCVSPSVGGNLGLIDHYSRWPFFIDVVKQSGASPRGFGPYDAPYDGVTGATVDSDGWPIGSAGLLINLGQENGGMNGDYLVQVKGNVAFSTSSFNTSLVNFKYDSSTGLTTGIIRFGIQAVQLMIQFKTAMNATMRDLKIIRPGYTVAQAEKQIYTDYTLAQLAKFSVLRFTDPTNAPFQYADVTEWSERSTPSSIFYSMYQGLPWEVVIDLANVLKKDIWINVPYTANDNYVTQLATLLKNSLSSNLKIYVEFSEKLWDTTGHGSDNSFDALQYVNTYGNIPLNYKGDKFAFDTNSIEKIWAYRRIAFKSMQISNIFATVYGESNRNNIFRVVVSGPYEDPRPLMYGLQMVQDLYGNPSNFFYALSIMPIVSAYGDDFTNLYTNEQILANMTKREQSVVNKFNNPFVLSKMFGLKVLASRGIIDSFAVLDGKRYNENEYDARYSYSQYSGLKQLVKTILIDWFSYGFDQFMFQAITPVTFKNPLPGQNLYAGIGFTDNYNVKSITEQAVEEVMALSNINVNIPNVTTIPGLINIETNQAFRSDQFFYISPSYPIISQLFFSVKCPKNAVYQVNLMAKAATNGTISFILNAKTISTLSFSSLGSYILSNDISFTMIEGFNILSLKINTANAFDLKYLNITHVGEVNPTSNSPSPIRSSSISVRMSVENSSSRMFLSYIYVILASLILVFV